MITTTLSVKYKNQEALKLEFRPCKLTEEYPYVKEVFITKKPADQEQLEFIAQFMALVTNQYGIPLCGGDYEPFNRGNLGYALQKDWEFALSKLPEDWQLEVINSDPAQEPPLPPGAIP